MDIYNRFITNCNCNVFKLNSTLKEVSTLAGFKFCVKNIFSRLFSEQVE